MKIRSNYFWNSFCGEILKNERARRKCLLDQARSVKKIAREFQDYQFRENITSDDKQSIEELSERAEEVLYVLKSIQNIRDEETTRFRVSRYRNEMSEILEGAKFLVVER